MATLQVLGSRDRIVKNNGDPASGYEVYVYEPDTTTQITSYKDSGLTEENTNPVILSGTGRAKIWLSQDADIRCYSPDGVLLFEELNVNPDDLSSTDDSGLISNGSFETDSDNDDIPDDWDNDVNDTNSSNAIDTTQSSSGGQSWRTQSTGNGGGELVTSSFFPVNDTDDLRVDFDLFSTVASVRNIVRVQWYDVSQVSISDDDIYDSTANPASWTSQNLLSSPPSGARFAKLRIIGGTTGGTLAGITYWDNFTVYYPSVVAGVFDNLTLSGNDIISTNTNGNINITPDGTGKAAITNLEALSAPQLGFNTEVSLEFTAAGQLRLRGDATTATPPTTETPNAVYQIWDQDATDLLGHLGFNGENRLTVYSYMHGASIALVAEDDSGDAQIILDGDPEGSSQMYAAGTVRLVALTGGQAAIRSDGNTDTENRFLIFAHQDGTERGRIGHETSDVFYVRNAIHGGNVTITAEDGSGTVVTLFDGDPDGSSAMYADGAIRLEALTGGEVAIRSDGSTDTEARRLILQHADGTARGYVGYTSDGQLRIANQVHGQPVRLQAENDSGSSVILLNGDPDGRTSLYYAGQQTLRTEAGGIASILGDQANDTDERLLQFLDSSANRRAFIGHNADGVLRIRNEVHGDGVAIEAEDNSGDVQTLLLADPDGGLSVYYAGARRAAMQSDGWTVYGSDNTDTNTDRRILLRYLDGTLRGLIGHDANGDLRFENQVHGANVVLDTEDSTGTGRLVLVGDPDGSLSLYHPDSGEIAIQTQDRTANDVVTSVLIRGPDNAQYDAGYALIPRNTISGGNETMSKNDVAKTFFYNESTARSLVLNELTDVPVDTAFCLIVGPDAGTLTIDGGTGVTINYWSGSGWSTTSAAGNLTAGEGIYFFWKDTDTNYYLSGPNLAAA